MTTRARRISETAMSRPATSAAALLGAILASGLPGLAWSQDPGGVPEADQEAGSPDAGFPFTAAPFENAVLEAGLDSLQVRFGDGRPGLTVPVMQRSEGPYISLPDLGRICACGFQWNPETWRGSVRIESTEVFFILDTQVFWVGGTPVQLPAPVRYDREQVWLPLGFLDGIYLPLVGDRAAWDPLSGRLAVEGPGPLLKPVTALERAGTVHLVLQPVGEDSLRLRWDPVGELHVEIRGASLPLNFRGPENLPEGIRFQRGRRALGGAELVFDVGPDWLGVQAERGRRDLQVVRLTRRPRDVASGDYQLLGHYLQEKGADPDNRSTRRTILLEIPSSAELSVNQAHCLESVVNELQQTLKMDFGHQVVILRDRGEIGLFHSPSGVPEIPPVPRADCWVGFRLEHWPGDGVREFLMVTPSPAPESVPPGERAAAVSDDDVDDDDGAPRPDYEADDLTTARLIPWGQTARLRQGASLRMAGTLSEHLAHEWEGRPVRITSRPARIFRGLAMPSVIISPGLAEDGETMDLLCDPVAAKQLVRNLAFGLDEFFMLSSREW